jgi:NitT/TauT family transport system substrate-binding protein
LFATTVQAQTLKVGNVGSPTILDLPSYVAVEKGFFSKYGLQVESPITFNNSPTSFVALVLGEIQFLSASMLTAVNDQHNSGSFLIGRGITKSPAYLISNPRIKNVSDLKGKTIAIGGENDITRMYAEIILRKNNVDPSSVNWFYSGDSSKRLVSIESNQIDAAIFFPPFNFLAEKEGYLEIGSLLEHESRYQKTLIFNAQWVKDNPTKVKAVISAYHDAINWINDSNNKTEAITILADGSGAKPEIYDKSYDWAIKEHVFITEDSISKSAVDYFIKNGKEWNFIKNESNIPIENLVVPGVQISD